MRKQAFYLFCDHCTKQEEEIKQKKIEEDKQRFQEMIVQEIESRLSSCPAEERILAVCKMDWRYVLEKYQNDERFLILPDAHERELFFHQILDRKIEEERQLKSQTRSKNMESFSKFLSSEPSVNVKTQWRVFRDRVEQLIARLDGQEKTDDEKGHEDDPILGESLTPEREEWLRAWKHLSPVDRLSVFESHIRVLDRKFLNDVQAKKAELSKKSRLAREAFRV